VVSVMGASDTDDTDALMLPEDTRAFSDIKPVRSTRTLWLTRSALVCQIPLS